MTPYRRVTAALAAGAALLMIAGTPAADATTTETPYPYAGPGPYASILAVGGPDQHVYTGWGGGKIVESADSGAELRTVADVGGSLFGLAVDPDGYLFVSTWNATASRPELSKLSPTGVPVWTVALADMDRRQSLALDGDVLWMTSQPDVIAVKTSTGEEVHRFSPNGWDVNPLPNGNVVVALQTGGMAEYTATGSYVRTVSTETRVPMAVTPSGAYVAVQNSAPLGSPASNSIRMWSPAGTSSLGHNLGTASARDIAVAPSGVVWAIINKDNQWTLLKIDPRTPDVALTTSGALAEVGVPVSLNASGSFVPFAAPSRYEWDLDGDGSFETDSGATGQITHSYASRGARQVRVRVSSPLGGSAVASSTIDVRAASPAGPAGVSINNGAMYTNDPHVTVHMRWPKYAQDIVISNDGGFFPASQQAVEPTMTWTLDSSGPERLPKTIYVRFAGGQSGAETYQDDIILDQTAPAVLEAKATAATRSSRLADLSPRAAKKYRLTLKAVDKTSGVAQMQITSRKAKPGAWLTFKRRTTFKSPTAKIFVRVQDRAGNVSGWKRLKAS